MKPINGTTYHDETPDKVIDILENARKNGTRLRLWYGKYGKCWNDEYDTIGKIGRSCGTSKIPLLIKSSRSYGGGAILDDCIVRIDSNNPRRILYADPTVKFDCFTSTDIGTVYNISTDTLYARCKNAEAGKRLAQFMNGERWAK